MNEKVSIEGGDCKICLCSEVFFGKMDYDGVFCCNHEDFGNNHPPIDVDEGTTFWCPLKGNYK